MLGYLATADFPVVAVLDYLAGEVWVVADSPLEAADVPAVRVEQAVLT